MRQSFSFKLFYRLDNYRDKALVKLEVHDGLHWLKGNELARAATTGRPTPVAAMVDVTYNLCVAHGLDASLRDRLLSRKLVTLNGTDVPLNDFVACGWDIEPYPFKHLPPHMVNHSAILADARENGIHLDVSNAVCDETTVRTRGLALKGLVDLARANAIPTRLYVDYSLFGWLKANDMVEVYTYLNNLLADHGPTRVITESKCGESVDPILLEWADRSKGHAISKDCFEDFDMAYEWLLCGAEKGTPRLHRFACDGTNVGIPDFGLSTKIPTSF